MHETSEAGRLMHVALPSEIHGAIMVLPLSLALLLESY